MFRRIRAWFRRTDTGNDDWAGRHGRTRGGQPSAAAQEARFRAERGGSTGQHGPGAFG